MQILQEARELLAKSEIEQAIGLLEKSLLRDKRLIEVRLLLAKVKAAIGDFDGFKRLADEALRVSLASAEGYLLKGMSYALQSDFEEAIHFYEMAIANNDRLILAHTNLGIALREIGDYIGAEKSLRRARQLDQKDPEIGYQLAQVFALQLRIREAINELIAAIRLNPLFLPAYLALGAIYKDGDNIDGTIEIYRAAISMRPDALEPKRRLANLYLEKNRVEDAIKFWKEIIDKEPSPDNYMQLGICAVAAKDFQLAEQSFLDASKINPDSWEAYYNLAELYDALDMDKPAGRAYEMSVRKNRGSYKPHNGYGLYLLKLGKIIPAVDHLIEAYELSDREPEPPYNLALAFIQANRIRDARQVLKESLAAGRLGYLRVDAERLLKLLDQEPDS